MSSLKLLDAEKSYSFRAFFEMARETDEILAEFGVDFKIDDISLRRAEVAPSITAPLKAQLTDRLKRVQLTSEMARREVLVSPILLSASDLSNSRVRIEYALEVDNHLKGKLDYLVEGKQHLLVVEAKNDDLARGFTQLAVEMIALSRRDPTQAVIYGAVTIGDGWRFGVFDTQTQQITQDIALHSVPEDTSDVLAILVGILTGA